MAERLELGQLGPAVEALGAPLTGRELDAVRRAIAVYLVGVSKKAVAQSVSPSGQKFADLAPSTLRGRRKAGRGAKPLWNTGILLAGFQAVPEGPSSLLWGNSVDYWHFHQTGTERVRTRKGGAGEPEEVEERVPGMPARRTVEAAPEVLDVVAEMAADAAVDALMRRSLRR